jgi:hypothetical protein
MGALVDVCFTSAGSLLEGAPTPEQAISHSSVKIADASR